MPFSYTVSEKKTHSQISYIIHLSEYVHHLLLLYSTRAQNIEKTYSTWEGGRIYTPVGVCSIGAYNAPKVIKFHTHQL